MFAGSMVALVTPMHSDQSVDNASFDQLIDWHLDSGTDAIVILGTTGEAAVLDDNERDRLIRAAIAKVKSQVPVIVGTGTNNTKKSIALTQRAMELGADGCLLVTPYYNKPSQEGLFQHFSAIAEAVNIPQILYNIPSRTGCDLAVDTVVRLANAHANIIGLKDASADFSRLPVLLAQTELSLYSGDDRTALDFMCCGGSGVISVAANIAPKVMHEMCDAVINNDMSSARKMNHDLLPWYNRLSIEVNPVPVKFVLQQMGKIASAAVRLPLVVPSDASQEALKQELERSCVIERR